MKISNVKRVCLLLATFFLAMTVTYAAESSTAIFSAGCFWCAEHDFATLPGVTNVISGYTGGHLKNPTYEEVSSGGTGHYESIEVIYNSKEISYQKLLDFFWHNVDPTDGGGQFCDRGDQYRAVIFYQTPTEKKLAEESKKALIDSGRFKQIATEILPAQTFYPAEDYHQKYADKNPVRYNFYRYSCGRDKRLAEIWGKKP